MFIVDCYLKLPMDVFAKLGIDWKLLIAQAVNFGILFLVLRRFAYKPMLDFLENRSAQIDKGLKDDALKKRGFEKDFIDKVQQLIKQNEFKRRPSLIAKLT